MSRSEGCCFPSPIGYKWFHSVLCWEVGREVSDHMSCPFLRVHLISKCVLHTDRSFQHLTEPDIFVRHRLLLLVLVFRKSKRIENTFSSGTFSARLLYDDRASYVPRTSPEREDHFLLFPGGRTSESTLVL